MHKEMKQYDFSKRLAKEKLRVYLTFMKGDKEESRVAIESFKAFATDTLSDAMDDKLGNIAILHSHGGYSEESKKTDEQSRQLAITLQNTVEVMDFLQTHIPRKSEMIQMCRLAKIIDKCP